MIELATFLLLVGVSVRLYIQNGLLKRMAHYLWEAEKENQQQIVEFMEGFSEALVIFNEEQEMDSVLKNSQAIKEWDEA